jgi:ribosomal protein S18 acetylase RimI-like enzyme
MPRIRAFHPGEEWALAEICLRTADAGGDATGVFDDDDIWAAVFVLPYLERHPDFAFVVETDDARPVGYIVGAPDTDAFEAWFARDWWPRFAERWPRPTAQHSRQDGTLLYAYGRDAGRSAHSDALPAHLHIDLLPEAQGQGSGRRLVDTLFDAFRAAGVRGVHLGTAASNAGAVAFYERLGFTALPTSPGNRAFGFAL